MIVAGRKLSFFQKSFLDENPLRFFFYHDCFRRRTGSSERSRPVNDRYPPAALERSLYFFRQNFFVADLKQDIGSDGKIKNPVS